MANGPHKVFRFRRPSSCRRDLEWRKRFSWEQLPGQILASRTLGAVLRGMRGAPGMMVDFGVIRGHSGDGHILGIGLWAPTALRGWAMVAGAYLCELSPLTLDGEPVACGRVEFEPKGRSPRQRRAYSTLIMIARDGTVSIEDTFRV